MINLSLAERTFMMGKQIIIIIGDGLDVGTLLHVEDVMYKYYKRLNRYGPANSATILLGV